MCLVGKRAPLRVAAKRGTDDWRVTAYHVVMTRPPFDPDRVRVPPEERVEHRGDATLTVTQLTALVKRSLERGLPRTVHVLGEISNFKRHSSGHLYFVIKDEHCELSCVMWRTVAAKLGFDLVDGLEVIATGQVDVFERSGRYQLYVRRLEPKGIGALELKFRQLREKLLKEGLFARERKQELPRFPERIAVVTSPTGAAVRDILQTVERRWPAVEVLLYPVTVQGPSAAGEIASAVRDLNNRRESLGGIDCMIVGRGGGSIEDLWAFNEEAVARAIFASRIPVVSAVGHEVDVSISDLVADVRAATPTAAAELVVPEREEVLARLASVGGQIARLVGYRAALSRAGLDGLTQRALWHDPLTLVRHREQTVDELLTRLSRSMTHSVHRADRRVGEIVVSLQAIRPEVYLAGSRQKLSEMVSRLRWTALRRNVSCERAMGRVLERFAAVSPAHRLELVAEKVDALATRLDAMSHKRTLRRGFSITRRKKGRDVVRTPDGLADGETVVTETAEGLFESRVINRQQREMFD